MPSTDTPSLDRREIRPGDRVCAAVSGGADSVAMLLFLHEANALPRNGLGIGLSAVHVHHGIRGEEADGDLEFVRELCGGLGVPLRVFEADVPGRVAAARSRGKPETLEEAARCVRYECFRELILAGEVQTVATAHTLEDQAETVLMKLLRGAWTEGLGGIFPVVEVTAERAGPGVGRLAGKIVRPLLGCRRGDLRCWLEGRGQTWREDASNADEAHTRNRLRHNVLPVLREENPSVDVALARVATLAREDEAHWSGEVRRLLPQIVLPGKPVRGGGRAVSTGGQGGAVAIELDRLRSLGPSVRRRVLRAAARELGCRLGFEDTERLLALADLPGNGPVAPALRRGAGKLALGGGLEAECSLRELRLQRLEP